MIASKVESRVEERIRLFEIPWDTYVAFADGLGDRRIRVTYDDGEMEIMTVSGRHEGNKTLLARLIEAMTEELDIDIVGRGNMTFRRKKRKVGMEPDECYWIRNERHMRDRFEHDSELDPPLDLALEVEISRSAMNRLRVYAKLGVAEVWCWDGEALRVYVLTISGTYRATEQSKAFPFLPLPEFTEFLHRTGVSDTQLLRSFRSWVQKNKRKWKATK